MRSVKPASGARKISRSCTRLSRTATTTAAERSSIKPRTGMVTLRTGGASSAASLRVSDSTAAASSATLVGRAGMNAAVGDIDEAPAAGRGNAASMRHGNRSEEHTSELQSLMRISYAVFCLKKKKINKQHIQK